MWLGSVKKATTQAPCFFLSDRRRDNSDECRSVEAFFLPCARKLPFGVGGQLQLRDVGQHRSVAGGEAGDPHQRGVGVHGGVRIQGHLLGCKRQTVIDSEQDEMMCVKTNRQRGKRKPYMTSEPKLNILLKYNNLDMNV